MRPFINSRGSARYPKLSQHGSITRPSKPRRQQHGVLAAFYSDTGRWLGQLSAPTLEQAKEQASERGIVWESVSFQKI